MSPEECQELCEAAGLNVRAVTQTARHMIAIVAREKRSSQTVIRRLQLIAQERELEVKGIVFSQSPTGDDEYAFRVVTAQRG
jgi:hypothetical protein